MAASLVQTGGESTDNSGAMRAMAQVAAALPSGPGPHWIDVRLLCEVVAALFAPRAERHRITIELSLPSEKTVVIGFAPLLLKALQYLTANALDAMPGGGIFTIRVYRDPYVVIECCDSGVGGALDHMTRSWRPQDIDRSAQRLVKARAIIQQHRGCLWQRAQPGGGSCLLVELPAAGSRK
jgi:signal transduction histidine kinase